MESQSNSTMNCTDAKRGVAQFVYDILKSFREDSPWIITIKPEKLEDYYAPTVTIESSEGIRTVLFSDAWLTTSTEEPAGMSRQKQRKRRNVE